MKALDRTQIDEAFALLGDRLAEEGLGPFRLVVCGGASLIAASLVQRTTKDVDVVALLDENQEFASPDPMPDDLLRLAMDVATELGIPEFWLNNGPSRGDGGLFQLGLPEGMSQRLTRRHYGVALEVYLVGRIDQIFFKLYAAVDRGPGRHLADLQMLDPTEEELEGAARWAMTHDVSEGYRLMLKSMLEQLGYRNVADRI